MLDLFRPGGDVDRDVVVVARFAQRDLARRAAVLRPVRDLRVVVLELVEQDRELLLLEPILVLAVQAFETLVAVAVDDVGRSLVLGAHERHAVELRKAGGQAGRAREGVARARDRAAAGLLGLLLLVALAAAAGGKQNDGYHSDEQTHDGTLYSVAKPGGGAYGRAGARAACAATPRRARGPRPSRRTGSAGTDSP